MAVNLVNDFSILQPVDWVNNQVTVTWSHDTAYISYYIYYTQNNTTPMINADGTAGANTTRVTHTPSGGAGTQQTKVINITRGAKFRVVLTGVNYQQSTIYQSNLPTTNDGWTMNGFTYNQSQGKFIGSEGWGSLTKSINIPEANKFYVEINGLFPLGTDGEDIDGFYFADTISLEGGISNIYYAIPTGGIYTITSNLIPHSGLLNVTFSQDYTWNTGPVEIYSIRVYGDTLIPSDPTTVVSYDSPNLLVSDYRQITQDLPASTVTMGWTHNTAYDAYSLYYTLDGTEPSYNTSTGAVTGTTQKIDINAPVGGANTQVISGVTFNKTLKSILVGKNYAVVYQSNFNSNADGWALNNFVYDSTNKRLKINVGGLCYIQKTITGTFPIGTIITVGFYIIKPSTDNVNITFFAPTVLESYQHNNSTLPLYVRDSHVLTTSKTNPSLSIQLQSSVSAHLTNSYIDFIKIVNPSGTITLSDPSPQPTPYTMPSNNLITDFRVLATDWVMNKVTLAWTHNATYLGYDIHYSIDGGAYVKVVHNSPITGVNIKVVDVPKGSSFSAYIVGKTQTAIFETDFSQDNGSFTSLNGFAFDDTIDRRWEVVGSWGGELKKLINISANTPIQIRLSGKTGMYDDGEGNISYNYARVYFWDGASQAGGSTTVITDTDIVKTINYTITANVTEMRIMFNSVDSVDSPQTGSYVEYVCIGADGGWSDPSLTITLSASASLASFAVYDTGILADGAYFYTKYYWNQMPNASRYKVYNDLDSKLLADIPATQIDSVGYVYFIARSDTKITLQLRVVPANLNGDSPNAVVDVQSYKIGKLPVLPDVPLVPRDYKSLKMYPKPLVLVQSLESLSFAQLSSKTLNKLMISID